MSHRNLLRRYQSNLFPMCVALLFIAGLASAVNAQNPALSQPVATTEAMQQKALGLGKVFTYFFVMLGPIKILAPFMKLTQNTDASFQRQLAVRAFFLACISGVVAAIAGQALLQNWGVSLPALLIAAGIVLFLVALRTVIQQYEPAKEQSPPPTPSLALAFTPLTFPTIITPYGTAVLVLLLAAAETISLDISILGIFLAVMVINLLAMLFAAQLLKFIGITTLRILGALLGILQVALAIQMILGAFILLGVLPPRS